MVNRGSLVTFFNSSRIQPVNSSTRGFSNTFFGGGVCYSFCNQGFNFKSPTTYSIKFRSKVWNLRERSLTNVNYKGCWAHTPEEHNMSFVFHETIF